MYVFPCAVSRAARRSQIHGIAFRRDSGGEIRRKLLSAESSGSPALVSRFHSGKRLYQCRALPLNPTAGGSSQSSLAVFLERSSSGSIPLAQVAEKFKLTAREQEVLQCLSEGGLTTKEIAARIGISPNTVKAFLYLIMLKMGVHAFWNFRKS